MRIAEKVQDEVKSGSPTAGAGKNPGEVPAEMDDKKMDWSEDEKLKILLAGLQERYHASHRIRERSMQFMLWISGIAVGLCWILISQKALSPTQQIVLSVLIVILFGGVLHFTLALRKGFENNRKVMIKFETILGLHTPGLFLSDGPLLPAEYCQTKRRWSDHFCTVCGWLVLVAMALLVLTWVNPKCSEIIPPRTQPTNVTGAQNG